MAEDTGGFLLLQIYIPILYPELLHPLYNKDKIFITFNILPVKR